MASYPESIDELSAPPKKRRWWRFVGRHLPSVSILVMATLLAIAILYPYVVITVHAGQVGVLWRRFFSFDTYCWCFVGRGTTLSPSELREEGLHIIWPWDMLFIYNLRLQSATQEFNAISKDGVNVAAQISARYQLRHDSVAVLHKFIGPQYFQSVIAPEIGSQARSIISQYSAQEVYTSRETIQNQIREGAQKSLGAHLNKLVQPEAMEELNPKNYNNYLQGSIQLLDTLVLSIELPLPIVAAINRQTEQYYMIQEYRFRVAREAEESKRKQIEANGITAFQKTVSQGISDSYLRWRGIEATLALAQSPNSKIVIIGSNKDGLPIILGNVDSPTTPNQSPQAAVPSTPSIEKTAPGSSSLLSPPAKPDELKLETPAGSPSGPLRPDPEKKPATISPTTPEKQSSSSFPLGLSDLQSVLGRISERWRSETPPPAPPTTHPKE